MPPSGFGGSMPLEEPEPMTEEEMLQLLVDCAVARLKGAHLTDHQMYQIKTALNHVSEAEAQHLAAEQAAKPEQLASQVLSFLLEQCVMEDLGVEMGPHAHVHV
ncbi:Hypothetical predicted protein [Xyrichtys novacula]|nr:Hypothetical predicted protein [Xyrichtys novacula]